MLILRSFAPAFGIRCPSPFGLKADALLAMSGLEYKVVPSDPRKAPMGKLPLLVDGDKEIPDSALIQRHLQDAHGVDLDKALTVEQKAGAKAIQRLLENHLYFAMVYFRWVENSDIVREEFFSAVPALMRKFVFRMVLKQLKRDLHGHGISRHARSDILRFALEDIEALSILLGDKEYFFGEPSAIDASAFGSLEGLLNSEVPSDLQKAAREFQNLRDYCDRFRTRFFD